MHEYEIHTSEENETRVKKRLKVARNCDDIDYVALVKNIFILEISKI